MGVVINLLGNPSIETEEGLAYRFRSRKSWALVAFLLLAGRPPSRVQVGDLLFGTADDPLRALRWSLTELRHALGDESAVEGDPVVLSLPEDSTVDVDVLTHGAWDAAVGLPGLGSDFLEGMAFRWRLLGDWRLRRPRPPTRSKNWWRPLERIKLNLSPNTGQRGPGRGFPQSISHPTGTPYQSPFLPPAQRSQTGRLLNTLRCVDQHCVRVPAFEAPPNLTAHVREGNHCPTARL
jgi:hypothetical protein